MAMFRERSIENSTQASHIGYSHVIIQKGRAMFCLVLDGHQGPNIKSKGATVKVVQYGTLWFNSELKESRHLQSTRKSHD